MFDNLVTIPDELKEELKIKTGGLLKENEKELQLFCPFCDDAYRKKNPKWGHLYIGKENLLFYCHRCGEKGHLIKLLSYLNINPNRYFSKEQIVLNQTVKKVETGDKNLSSVSLSQIFNFYREKDKFKTEIEYVEQRTGINPNFFILYGITVLEKQKIHFFTKSNKTVNLVLFRNLNPKFKLRYKKISKNDFWLKTAARWSEIEKIIIAEGVFDVINIFRQINFKNSFYVASLGNYYQKTFEKYFFKFPFVKEFHFFLDNDINEKKLFFRLKTIIEKFHQNNFFISKKKIIFYKNPRFKDFGEIQKFDYEKKFEIIF